MLVERVLDELRVTEVRAGRAAALVERGARRHGAGVQSHRDVEFLGEREVRIVFRVAQRVAGVLRRDLAEHAKLSGRERLAQHGEVRQRCVLRAANARARDEPCRVVVAPPEGRGEPVAVAAADHALHDVVALHLGQAGG
jgi:hypothetical protein